MIGQWPIYGLLIVANLAQADDAPVGLADLDAYRVALASKSPETAPQVRFRDLWDRPEAFSGKPVTIAGRLARRFRQPRFGEFPPLVEAWVVSPAGDPFCVVFADESATTAPEIGSLVRFSGTFLRRIQYQGGDTARVVPLIVGPRPPMIETPESGLNRWSWSSIDWIVGLGATAAIVGILTIRHVSKPVVSPERSEPHPVFIDGDPEAEGNSLEDSD